MAAFTDTDLEADRTYSCRRIPPLVLGRMISIAARGNKDMNALALRLRDADAMLNAIFQNGGSQRWQHASAYLNGLGVRIMREIGVQFYELREDVEDEVSAAMLAEIPCDEVKGFGWSYMFGTQCPPMANGIHLDITEYGGEKVFELLFLSYDMTDEGVMRPCGEVFCAPTSLTPEPMVRDSDLLEVFSWKPTTPLGEEPGDYDEFKKGWNGRVDGTNTDFTTARIVFKDKLGTGEGDRNGRAMRDATLLLRVIDRIV